MSSTTDKSKKPVFINKPLDWATTFNLSEATKSIRFVSDGEGNIWGMPVVLVDPRATAIQGGQTKAYPDVVITNIAGNPVAVSALSTALATTTYGLDVNSSPHLYKFVDDAMEPLRTPDTWKYAGPFTAAGNCDVWDPAAGKTVRLMGFHITVSKETACAGAFFIYVADGANPFMRFDVSTAALVATGQVINFDINFPGNGYLSAAADNILRLQLSANTTAGGVSCNMWGVEE